MLILAARQGFLSVCKWLLTHGCDSIVDEQNCIGSTALHEALSGGFIEVAEVLLAAGANATLRDDAGRQCSVVASTPKEVNVGKELIHSHLLKVDGVDSVDPFSRILLKLVRANANDETH